MNAPTVTLFNSAPAIRLLEMKSATNYSLSTNDAPDPFHDGKGMAFEAATLVVQRAYNEMEVHLDCLASAAHERQDHDEAWRIQAIRNKLRTVLGAL